MTTPAENIRECRAICEVSPSSRVNISKERLLEILGQLEALEAERDRLEEDYTALSCHCKHMLKWYDSFQNPEVAGVGPSMAREIESIRGHFKLRSKGGCQ